MYGFVSWLYKVLILFCAANLAQIAFESVVSVVNSLHNSQELAKDHQGRNCLLATYLYFVFRLPDTQHEIHTTGTVGLWYHLESRPPFFAIPKQSVFFLWVWDWLRCCLPLIRGLCSPGAGGLMAHQESRYSTLTRTSANTVGFMLLQSRIRSSSNPDIPAPQTPEDAEVNSILGKVHIHKCNRNMPI